MDLNRPLLFVLATMTLAIGEGCAPVRVDTETAAETRRRIVRLLESPAERDAAACQLLKLGRYRGKPGPTEEPCKQVSGAVNHVIAAPQQAEPPMYVVFRHWDFDVDGIGPGQARGPFVLFDGDGRLVPVFIGANYLDPDSEIFSYAGDTRLAVAQVILHGSGVGKEEWTAHVLHIVPVEPDQQSVLSVILGPATYGFDDECAGFYWGWRRRDLDGDGVSEIEIGPWQNQQGDILPRAVYRWSRETGRYDGPPGSVQEGFIRIDGRPVAERPCDAYSKAIELFALARLRLPTPGDPSAIRRSKCERFGTGVGSAGAAVPNR